MSAVHTYRARSLFFEKLKILSTSIATILIPIVIAVIGNQYTEAVKEKEARLKLVELSIQILIQKKGDENKELRKWATDVINKYSEVPLNGEVKEALISNKVSFPSTPLAGNGSQATIPVSKFEEILKKKNLLPSLCDARSLIANGAPSANAFLNACKEFREVLKQIPASVLSETDKGIVSKAEEDFKNNHFEDASRAYDQLFNDYDNGCTN